MSNFAQEDFVDYNDFIKALLRANVEEMNAYMEQVAESVFSSLDSGVKSSETAPRTVFPWGCS